jgi:hypothetical protein
MFDAGGSSRGTQRSGFLNRYVARLSAISTLALVGAAPASVARSLEPALVIDDVSIHESDSGTTTAFLGVSLASAVVHGEITASFSTIAGTATEGTSCTVGVDFIGAHNQTLSLTPRQMNGRIAIQVCGDTRFEPTEAFKVMLFNPTGAVIQKSEGQVKIVDNDPAPVSWGGLTADGTIAKAEEQRWGTPLVTAGDYVFTMSHVSGDADLYVRIGAAPTTNAYSCRPAKSSADEICLVSLTVPSVIFVMVRGYATSSTFKLKGSAK